MATPGLLVVLRGCVVSNGPETVLSKIILSNRVENTVFERTVFCVRTVALFGGYDLRLQRGQQERAESIAHMYKEWLARDGKIHERVRIHEDSSARREGASTPTPTPVLPYSARPVMPIPKYNLKRLIEMIQKTALSKAVKDCPFDRDLNEQSLKRQSLGH